MMSLLTLVMIGVLTGWMSSKIVEEYVWGEIGGMIAGVVGAFMGALTGKILFNLYSEATFGTADFVGSSAVGAISAIIVSGWCYRFIHTQKILKTKSP